MKQNKEKMKQKKVNRPKKRSLGLQEESSEEDEVGLAEPILDDS